MSLTINEISIDSTKKVILAAHPSTKDPRDWQYTPKNLLPNMRTLIPKAAPLPRSIDLRSKNPSVYDQLNLGSCTANAAAAAYSFLSLTALANNRVTQPSRLFIYYNTRSLMNTINSDSGASLRDTMRALNRFGVCAETSWSYNTSKFRLRPTPDNTTYTEALKHRSVNYFAVQNTERVLCETLRDGFPIIFGFLVYSSFLNSVVARTGQVPVPGPKESILGGHAVMIVGYDLNRRVFIVRNSWGVGWGDRGYFYMPFDYVLNSNRCWDFWVLQTITDRNVSVGDDNLSSP